MTAAYWRRSRGVDWWRCAGSVQSDCPCELHSELLFEAFERMSDRGVQFRTYTLAVATPGAYKLHGLYDWVSHPPVVHLTALAT